MSGSVELERMLEELLETPGDDEVAPAAVPLVPHACIPSCSLVPLPAEQNQVELVVPQSVMAKHETALVELQQVSQDACVVLQHILHTCMSTGHFTPKSDVSAICKCFLEEGKHLHQSKEGIARHTGAAPENIESRLVLLVNSYLHLERLQMQHVLELCQGGQAKTLLYLAMSRYDETPMRVRIKQAFAFCFNSAGTSSTSEGVLTEESIRALSTDLADFMQQDAVLCKLFATESKYAVLLKHGGGEVGRPSTPKYILIEGQTLTHLQCLQSATGNAVYKALCVNNNTKAEFPATFKARLTCTDQAAYNYVAEEKMLDAWGDEWTGCHTACNLHVVARVLTRTMLHVDSHIQGLLHFSLALSNSSALQRFRHALAQVLLAKQFVVRVGRLPSEALAYKKFILDLFLTTGTRKDIRKHLLSSVATGDWRKEELEVYVAAGVSYDATELRLLVIKGLIIALVSTVFHTYPRHRWTGADLSTDQVGLLLAVHNVGASALVQMASHGRNPKDHSETHFGLGEQGPEEAVEHGIGVNFDDVVPQHSLALASTDEAISGQEQSEPISFGELAARNAKFVQKALAWVERKPLAHVMVLRLCMNPIMNLLHEYLGRSGDEWEIQNLTKHSKVNADAASITTSFMAYVGLTSEQAFYSSLQELLHSRVWGFIAKACHTMEMQCLAFRMLSRMGALVWELLVTPTMLAPLTLFKVLLTGGEAAEKLHALPRCMQDDFTHAFLTSFPDLLSEDALMALKVIAEKQRVDTVQLEWGHGRVNRALQQRIQTQKPSLEYLNAMFVCQKHREQTRQLKRRGWAQCLSSPDAAAQQMAADSLPASDAKCKKRGGGGAWRAFLAEVAKGGSSKADVKALTRQYKQEKLDDTESFQRWVRVGKSATLRHQLTGLPSFGPTRRTLVRASRRNRLALQAVPSQTTFSNSAFQLVDSCECLQRDMKAELTHVRRVALFRAKQERKHMEDLTNDLLSHVLRRGPEARDELVRLLPAFRACQDHLH
eukprot:6492583-Amphidinium_carterae.1